MSKADEFFQKYWLTITICSIFFVIFFITFFLNLYKKELRKKKGEASKSYCPDYWTIGSEKRNKVTCVPPTKSVGITAKEKCLTKNKTWRINKDKTQKCQWAKECEQQWYGIYDDNNSYC